ncbi:glycosyltransferase family 4 protein [Larkinella soli]|uniref:glycosyltransferase family 4 protein n=1 Tax=Larkinella soli TaxID=1770527 RepID=UPI00286DC1F9|nr:glycosyltransferase family 4 protein [Larkinella soli]
MVVSVNDVPEGYDYPEEVRYEFYQNDLNSYKKAAEFLNAMNPEVVCLQHEYGIFGGTAGNYILTLLRNLTMPVVTTLHTVLKNPDKDQLMVLKSIIDLSARVIVMTEKGRQFLKDIYEVPDEKIDVIAHGIPDMPFVDPHFYKDRFGIEGKQVLLTFGLLSPNKGIENVIKALPRIVNEFPNTVYIVLGATHPNLVREQGEVYRDSLKKLAADSGVKNNVMFFNQFVDLENLIEFLGAADIYITPYLNPAQITSGTLSYAFGCGKAVVSTPYWHAEELLADGKGILVPFNDADAIAGGIIKLMRDDRLRHGMRKKAYLAGRKMIWEHVMECYVETFLQARLQPIALPGSPIAVPGGKTGATVGHKLPAIRLEHLFRLTDSTGIIQHARYHLPHYEEGYCTDDNARALILGIMLEGAGLGERKLGQLIDTYATFLNYAFTQGRFRNFMSYDRRWLEDVGSDDSSGRAVWALGVCVGQSNHKNLISWAMPMLHQALPTTLELSSPRAWAFGVLGACEYLKRFPSDRLVKTILHQLVDKLVQLHKTCATRRWPWFEEYLTYDNAKLSHALIISGETLGDKSMVALGLKTLDWLVDQQISEGEETRMGHFQPIGSNGFYHKGGERAYFDQQPLEAQGTLSACLAAFRTTQDTTWLKRASKIFKWYSGHNDLGLSLYDPETGGCRDGLQVDRVNLNQGAESTLSYLLALTELHLVQKHLSEMEIANTSISFLV